MAAELLLWQRQQILSNVKVKSGLGFQVVELKGLVEEDD